MSLNARERTWWTPGRPLAVGGPSQKTHGSAPSRRRSDSRKTSRSRQRSRTCSSSLGNDWFGFTGRGDIWSPHGSALVLSTRLVLALLLALAALPAAPAGAATWSDPARVADAGQSSAPRLAGAPGGRLAVAFLRRAERPRQDPVIRAEVRFGTARDGLRGDSIVLTDGQA